jgi:predicted ester cyclase
MGEMRSITAVAGLAEAIRAGDPEGIAAAISHEWFDGSARPSQPSPPDVWRNLARDVFAAFGNPDVTVVDATSSGDADSERVSARLTVAGTHSGRLWGLPGTGRRTTVTATLRARIAGGRLAVAFEDVALPAVLREIGVVPQPEGAHLPPAHPVSLPEVVMKMVFNGGVLEKACSHRDLIRVHEPSARVCGQCVALGAAWPALRMCLTCGHVGCCDRATHKHALRHSEETGHPLIRSIHLGEEWMWCYADQTILSPPK